MEKTADGQPVSLAAFLLLFKAKETGKLKYGESIAVTIEKGKQPHDVQ